MFESILNKTPTGSALISSNATFYFDITTNESHVSKLNIADNPIESGATISDHATLEPKEISITGIMVGYTPKNNTSGISIAGIDLSDYPLPLEVTAISDTALSMVSSYSALATSVSETATSIAADFLPSYFSADSASSSGRISTALDQLLELQKSGEVLTLQTASKQYENMMIVSLQLDQTNYMSGYFSLALREVFIVDTSTASGLTDTTKSSSASGQQTSSSNLGKTQPTEVDNSALNSSYTYVKSII